MHFIVLPQKKTGKMRVAGASPQTSVGELTMPSDLSVGWVGWCLNQWTEDRCFGRFF